MSWRSTRTELCLSSRQRRRFSRISHSRSRYGRHALSQMRKSKEAALWQKAIAEAAEFFWFRRLSQHSEISPKTSSSSAWDCTRSLKQTELTGEREPVIPLFQALLQHKACGKRGERRAGQDNCRTWKPGHDQALSASCPIWSEYGHGCRKADCELAPHPFWKIKQLMLIVIRLWQIIVTEKNGYIYPRNSMEWRWKSNETYT